MFTDNTLFSWIADYRGTRPLISYSYGIIDSNGSITINIDDENGKNKNYAQEYRLTQVPGGNSIREWVSCPELVNMGGITCWGNTSYNVAIH